MTSKKQEQPKSLPRRISASAIKQLDKCSIQFYMSRYLKLPEKVWMRTICGSLVHVVLECLYYPRHRKHYDAIKAANTIHASPAVTRLVRRWQVKHNISNALIADIDPMVMLVFNHVNFLDEGAIKSFEPEHEFNITLRNGGWVVGFIDRMVEFTDRFVIRDWKSQKDRFTKQEIEDSFQSLVYQLYVWKQFGKLASVEYVLLRHPPTTLKKDRHLQVTKPATPAQLAGFELYLEHMAEVFNSFTEEDAMRSPCSDLGFCRNVCSFYRPVSYMVVTNRDGTGQERRYWIDPKNIGELPYQVKEHETYVIKEHPGCPRYNRS